MTTTKDSRGLSLRWTQHLKAEEKADFELQIKNSVAVLSRLKQIVEEDMATLNNSEMAVADFDNAAWAYKQAFRNGCKSALNRVNLLLNFLDQRK